MDVGLHVGYPWQQRGVIRSANTYVNLVWKDIWKKVYKSLQLNVYKFMLLSFHPYWWSAHNLMVMIEGVEEAAYLQVPVLMSFNTNLAHLIPLEVLWKGWSYMHTISYYLHLWGQGQPSNCVLALKKRGEQLYVYQYLSVQIRRNIIVLP